MPIFGKESVEILKTIHPDLQCLALEVVKHFDCKLLCGKRDKAGQDAAYNAVPKKSKTPWPESKHNATPSAAMDLAPFPVVWPDKKVRPDTYEKDLAKWYMFGGFVVATAIQMGIKIRPGFDWDRDFDILDQSFDDLPHFELAEYKEIGTAQDGGPMIE